MTQQQWNQPADDDVQVPLGAGGDASADPVVPAERKPKISGPTFVLFGAFASGLAVIYLLGMQNKPQAASAEQVAREQHATSAITELLQKNGKAEQLQGLFTDTKKLVRMFYSYLGAQHAEIPHLTHDPFGENEAAGPQSPAREAMTIVSTNPADAEKLRQIAETFGTLKLQSVMVGKNSIAMINHRMVQAGNKIGELTVVSIESERVLLSYGKNVFELKLVRPDADK